MNWYQQGGAAFPIPCSTEVGAPHPEHGMSLRDYFAGQALTGMIAGSAGLVIAAQEFAEQSYALADAMLEARKIK